MKKQFIKRGLFGLVCLVLCFAMLFNLASCGIRINAKEISDGYKRTATNKGEVTDEFKLALADFSMSLFKGVISKDDKNELISPLSVVLCLAMLANGADGNTKTQIEEVFKMDINTLNECLYAYTKSLFSSDKCKVNIANSIWFRDGKYGLKVNKAFLQANADWYDAQIYSAPFDDTMLKDINNWCKKYTDGMIEKIIDEINHLDMMYLINTLVFDAKWEVKYTKKQINDHIFTSYDGRKSTVEMMSSVENIYFSMDGVTGFSKNYNGKKYSFVGLLPSKETDIYDFIDSLDGEMWQSIWKSKIQAKVHAKMPSFEYDTGMKLNDTLKSLGITDMFDPSRADLSKIASEPLYCSSVYQKARIEVTPKGTRAAAVTIIEVKATSAEGKPKEYYVTLDRPFVYAIVDNISGLPLFIGAVTNLS